MVNLRAIFDGNRADGEFFQPKYLKIEQTLRAVNATALDDYLVDIRYGLNVPAEYVEDGLPFVRALNLKEYGIEGEILGIPYTPEQVGGNNLLEEGDILIVRSGANVGDLGIAISSLVDSTFGSYIIRMRVHDIDPFFLYVYLKSKFGREQTVRFRSGAAQPNISIPNLKRVLVFRPSGKQQRSIKDLLLVSYHKRTEAEQLYAEAEALLLAELGLDALDLSHQPTYTQSFSQAWASGRLDAEHFQPKYFEAFDVLTQFDHKPLIEVARLKKGRQARGDDEGGSIPYTSIKDIDGFLIETEELTDADDAVLASPDTVVLAITGATIGKTAINAIDQDIAISGDLVAIEAYRVSPYYLLVVMGSPLIQMLCEQHTTGATNGHLAVSGVAKFPIPILSKAVMQRISDNVQRAIEAHYTSKRLLEEARRRVEEMVLEEERV